MGARREARSTTKKRIEQEQDFIEELAREFKQPSYRAMLASMSSTEYLQWARHFTRHGFSRSTSMFSMGQICAAIWNVNLAKDKQVSPADFYPLSMQKPKPKQTSEQIQAMMDDDNLGFSFPAPKVSDE